MISRLRLIRTKSRNGLIIPLNTRLTVDGLTVEVWGLVKTDAKQRAVLQWWIVCPVKCKSVPKKGRI